MADIFTEFLGAFWFIFPVLGAIVLFIFWTSQKKISNKVLYVRRGNTMEFMACQVKGGSHIIFKPDKTSGSVTVHMKDKPYLFVQNGNMYRIYIVREGGGSTIRLSSNPEQVVDFNRALEQCYNMLPENVRSTIDPSEITKVSGQFLALIGASEDSENVGFGDDEDIDEPTARAAASSISLFERVNEFIISNLPKTKSQYLVMIIYLIVGYIGGMTLGILIDRIWLK